jgi:uncharacterized protein (TIGR02145 family)
LADLNKRRILHQILMVFLMTPNCNIMNKRKLFIITALLGALMVLNITCKKDDDNDNPPDPEPPVYTDGQGSVGKIGGTVKIEESGSPINGASIEIPEGALSENVNISIAQPDSNYYINGSNENIVIDILPSGIQFTKPVKIGIPYTSYSDEEYFSAFYYNPEEGILEELDPVSIDKTNKIFYCETDHTSLYTCQEVKMDIELVRVNDDGTTRIGAFANIWTPFESIPTGWGFALNGHPDAYSILYSSYVPGVTSNYQVRLFEKGNNSAVGEIDLDVWINKTSSGNDIGAVQVGTWTNGTYQMIMEEEYLQKDYIASPWMSGFPLLFTFKNFSPDDSKEYYAKVTWVEGKRNTSTGQMVYSFTDYYRLGKKRDAQKISDLSWEDGDADLNYILDDYEEGSGGNLPPIDPHSPTPEPEATNVSTNPTLSWECSDPDGDDLDYHIYFGTSPNPPLAEEHYTSTSWNPGTVDENTTYYWYIKAFEVGNDDHYSQSDPWEFTTGGGSGQTPVAPDNVYAGDWYDSPGVYWDDNSSNETGFKVYRAVNQINSGYSLLGEANMDETHFPDDGISNDNYYCYMLKAYNEYGLSEPSEYAVVPKTPTSMQGQAYESDILIYWTNPNNSQADRFYIQRKEGASGVWNNITWVSAPETSYQDKNVQPGKQYYYRVHSAWIGNNSDFTSKSFPSNAIGPYEISGGGGNGCDGITEITYGGQTYNTVEIGNQCWLAENLNYEAGNSWCYDNNPSNCDTYGRLYDWETALTVCPSGWKLPSDDEWKILEGTVDSQYPVGDPEWDDTGYRGLDAGKNLKSTSGWNSNGNGTDLYGFGALPGGYRYSGGSFGHLGYYGYWWSSSEHSGTYAWSRGLFYGRDGSSRYRNYKTHGFSVRCLKD